MSTRMAPGPNQQEEEKKGKKKKNCPRLVQNKDGDGKTPS